MKSFLEWVFFLTVCPTSQSLEYRIWLYLYEDDLTQKLTIKSLIFVFGIIYNKKTDSIINSLDHWRSATPAVLLWAKRFIHLRLIKMCNCSTRFRCAEFYQIWHISLMYTMLNTYIQKWFSTLDSLLVGSYRRGKWQWETVGEGRVKKTLVGEMTNGRVKVGEKDWKGSSVTPECETITN